MNGFQSQSLHITLSRRMYTLYLRDFLTSGWDETSDADIYSLSVTLGNHWEWSHLLLTAG